MPAHFKDYVCSQTQTSWCNLIFASKICLAALEQYPEPSTYDQAAKHPGWAEAMDKEIQAL